ncbi:hypothetical protein BOTBODRAFT_181236 [Botryobasidium botryosum FD-172 SS1]|uniref:Uncharacterized protein n=1 Tax=Botryobasidium botryosum (strain FD-172 SS1) TaxID=930990 RepID=A0A067LX07_BOTB1|nr:hypothetical protein BOTBODRAFT_181236 [Botryobasidium botryosum FD-172 SS1]
MSSPPEFPPLDLNSPIPPPCLAPGSIEHRMWPSFNLEQRKDVIAFLEASMGGIPNRQGSSRFQPEIHLDPRLRQQPLYGLSPSEIAASPEFHQTMSSIIRDTVSGTVDEKLEAVLQKLGSLANKPTRGVKRRWQLDVDVGDNEGEGPSADDNEDEPAKPLGIARRVLKDLSPDEKTARNNILKRCSKKLYTVCRLTMGQPLPVAEPPTDEEREDDNAGNEEAPLTFNPRFNDDILHINNQKIIERAARIVWDEVRGGAHNPAVFIPQGVEVTPDDVLEFTKTSFRSMSNNWKRANLPKRQEKVVAKSQADRQIQRIQKASGVLTEKSGVSFTPILEEEYVSDEVSSDGDSGDDESPVEKKARRLAWREKVCKMAGFDDDAAKRKASEKGKVWEVAVPQFRSTELSQIFAVLRKIALAKGYWKPTSTIAQNSARVTALLPFSEGNRIYAFAIDPAWLAENEVMLRSKKIKVKKGPAELENMDIDDIQCYGNEIVEDDEE